MDTQRKKGLLDTCVLAVLKKGPSYGYELIGLVSPCIPVSESTLYPVLRRLQKEACLDTYDRAFAGRNRRYYSITEKGCEKLEEYRHQWREYEQKVNTVLFGEAHT